MFALDIRTTYLIIGLLYLVLPVVAWIVLAGQHTRAVTYWCGGGLLGGVGLLLIGLRGSIPDLASFALANLLIMIGNLWRNQSLRMDLNIPWRTRWVVLAALVFVLVFEWIHQGLQNPLLRVIYVNLVWTGMLVQLVLLASRIAKKENSRSAKWIASAYLLVAASLVLRIVSLITGHASIDLMATGLDTQLISLTAILAAVVGHFGYVGLALDRSMRREVNVAAALARDEESRRLGEQIAQLDRQRSLGEMSASLGHELNQPLTAILTNAQVAQRGLQAGRFDTTQLTEFIVKIIQNTQRASQIIDRIRGFIRPVTNKREPVNLVDVVQEVGDLVANEMNTHKVHLSLVADSQPVWVTGDPIQLSQIVLNVVRNACDALSQVNNREIRIAIFSRDERAFLQIRDTGPGIDPEVLGQAGTPFFTTKPSGLGMGLSISRSIAEQHGGTLTITNANGGGAQVELELAVLPAPTFKQAAK